MEADNLILIPDENIADFSRRILEREYEEIAKVSVAVIVSTAFDIINEYRKKGMTFDQIATAYTKNGVPMKGATLRWAFGRAMKSRKSLQGAPSAREGREQANALPPTVPDQVPATATAGAPPNVVAQAGAEAPPTATPETTDAPPPPARPRPVRGKPRVLERERVLSDGTRLILDPETGEALERIVPDGTHLVWVEEDGIYVDKKDLPTKSAIDRLFKEIPHPDKEYPELVDKRFWTDPETGKKYDVFCHEFGSEAPPKPEPDGFTNAKYMYSFARRNLLEQWGVISILDGSREAVVRYKLAKKYQPPLTIDPLEMVKKHLPEQPEKKP